MKHTLTTICMLLLLATLLMGAGQRPQPDRVLIEPAVWQVGTAGASREIRITFEHSFTQPPRVFVQPVTLDGAMPDFTRWWISEIDETGFVVQFNDAGFLDAIYWLAIGPE